MLCHKSSDISGVVIAGVVLFISSDAAIQQYRKFNRIEKHSESQISSPVPFLGVLTFGKEYKDKIEKVIPVIMLSDKTGIADARMMSLLNKYNWKTIKNHTYVMFLSKEKRAWYATVESYILHPEYTDDTLTTIAFLNIEHEKNFFEGNKLMWPFNYDNPFSMKGPVLTIGYTNRNNILEQTKYHMDYVELKECKRFYIQEELDSKWMSPKHYHCYHVRYSKETCVFEPGMVLVHYTEGKYYLMGISTWGPGCSLPTRFLDFEPYAQWVRSKMPKRSIRRVMQNEITDVNRTDRDQWMLERIKDEKGLTLRPLKPNILGGIEKEVVHGKCDIPKDGELIYREVTDFSFSDKYLNNHEVSLAVYGLSLYDVNFPGSNYTCIQVLAKCNTKSDSQLEFTKGFEQGSFEPYIKRIPVPHSSFQKHIYKPYIHTLKENWETYDYEILGSEITHLTFRFQFEMNAQFQVEFFGKRIEPTTTTESTTTEITTTVETTPRTLRPYTTVFVTTPAPDYYYDGWWFVKGPKVTTNGTTPKTRKTTNTAYWWNQWWKFNQEDHKEWYKG